MPPDARKTRRSPTEPYFRAGQDRGREDPAAQSQSERLFLTLGAHSAVRGHRPDADRRSAAPAGDPGRIRRAAITGIVLTGAGTCAHRTAVTTSRPRSPTWRRRPGYGTTVLGGLIREYERAA